MGDTVQHKPTYYKGELIEIEQIHGETNFKLKDSNTSKEISIKVDQPFDVIKSRIQEMKNGSRDKLYLTYGMRDIDLSIKKDGLIEIFDEFDFYSFPMED